MKSTNEVGRELIDSLPEYLTDKTNHKRKVLAVYLTGSFARQMATKDSDLDLALIVKPSKYDYLTAAKLDHQKVFARNEDNEILFDDLENLFNLNTKLHHLDVRFISVPSFYEQLCKMDPNIFDIFSHGAHWFNAHSKTKWIYQDEFTNLVAKLQHMPLKYKNILNLPHFLSALLGISNNVQRRLTKNPNNDLKMVDTIKYFAKFTQGLMKSNYPNVQLPELTFSIEELNYYHLHHDTSTNSAISEINDCIAFFKECQQVISDDKELPIKQQKAQNVLTGICLEAMKF